MSEQFIPFTFLGLSPADFAPAAARYSIVPVAYEGTVTYGTGTKNGPAAMISASREVETYDAQSGIDLAVVGIRTLAEVAAVAGGPQEMITRVEKIITSELDQGMVPIMLGGEHSLTLGAVRACQKKHPQMSVLQIDAHLDLRASYQGSPFSHASVMRRVHELCPHVAVGIRNCAAEEKEVIDTENIPVFWAGNIVNRRDWFDRCLESLSDEVYLTFDLDGLDPSIMPAVGTPEPGGLGWSETIAFLQHLFTNRRVIGADVMELSPVPGLLYPDFTAASLVATIIRLMHISTQNR